MTHSANEVMKLAERAARGAGFPPAQAESFGQAAVVHLGAGRDADALLKALADAQDSPVLRLALLPEDILRAVRLMGARIALTLHPGDETLAMAYARLVPHRLVSLRIDHPDDGQPRLHVEVDLSTAATPSLPPRIDVEQDVMARLAVLARRTYVPASETSRAAAGAGNIDND